MRAIYIAAIIVLAGCATSYPVTTVRPAGVSESGQAFDMALADQFVKGVSVRADVERIYGKPGTVMEIGNSTIIGYNYMGVIAGKPGLVFGQTLLLTFGQDGRLSEISRSTSNTPIR